MSDEPATDATQWYWDRRINKAIRIVQSDEETVTFQSVWHADEFEEAKNNEALTPIENIKFGDNNSIEFIDSFRTDSDRLELGESDS